MIKVLFGLLIGYGLLAINFQLGLYLFGFLALWWGLTTDYWKKQRVA